MAVDFLDRYSRGESVCHRLPARAKVIIALGVVLAAVIAPEEHWPLPALLGCLAFAGLSLAGIPLAYLVHRVALFLPLVSFIALMIPLSRGFEAGWEQAAAIVLRSLVAFLAALWLVNTTPFDRLLAALSSFGVPRVFVSMLAFAYRYLFVVFDELARMRAAQRARTFGRRGAWQSWKSRAQLVAMLVVRSMSRADRVHGAMCARGWRGEIHTLD